MVRTTDNPWLHRFAVFTAVCTLGLIAVGGMVTSHGVGMAVPDWPTSYGYNMFLLPFSHWLAGIGVFWEHSHRLFASVVGLLTTILAVWLWLKEERQRLRWLGVIAFFAVVFQGILGGLRVTLIKDQLGIFHASLAQLFLVLICFIAVFTSRAWLRPDRAEERAMSRRGQMLLLVAAGLVFLQLVIGATMRHQHAGLAVPDFPLAYGQVWPAMDEPALAGYNQNRLDTRDYGPVTAFQVALHMAHRVGAGIILLTAGLIVYRLGREPGAGRSLIRLSWLWLGLFR
jgi:cytochrome c oxidase assembly protein subunit 15